MLLLGRKAHSMAAATSHKYVKGINQEKLPEYYVPVTEKQLADFEIWNSLVSNEGYEVVIYTCEQYFNQNRLPVVPSEVLAALMTLVTVGEYNKIVVARKMDPFDHGREALPLRSLRLLNQLFSAVQEFDSGTFELQDLELLRCQFFYLLDSIEPQEGRSMILDPPNSTNVSIQSLKVPNREPSPFGSSGSCSAGRTLYSYINLIDSDTTILKTPLTTNLLSKPGSFWNCLAWALSSYDDASLGSHLAGKKWLLVFKLLFEIYELRQSYFLRFESSNISHSPVVKLFNCLDKKKHVHTLLDYLFVGCVENPQLYPVPPLANETVVSANFLYPFENKRSYNQTLSMQFRAIIIGYFLTLVTQCQESEESARFNMESFVDILTDLLYTDFGVDSFQRFMLAILSEFGNNLTTNLVESFVNRTFRDMNPPTKFKLKDALLDFQTSSTELILLIKATNKFAALNRNRAQKKRRQVDFCIILFAKLMASVHRSAIENLTTELHTTLSKFAATSEGLKDLPVIFRSV